MSILDGSGPGNLAQPAQEFTTTQVAAPQVTPAADPLAPQQAQQSSGGFLNDLGVDWTGLDVNNEPPAGTHHGFIVKSEIRNKKDGTKSWVFSYRVADGEHEGKVKEDWRPIPQVANGKFIDDKQVTFARFLKQRLMELGVPEERVGTVTPADVQGTEVYFTIQEKNGYRNVVNVVLAKDVPTGALSQTMSQPVQGLI